MARCTQPFRKKGETQDVPCNKCLQCKKKRVSGWSFRLQNEGRYASTAYFVTLTYDTEHVPLIKNYRPMTLCKRDVQLFFKKLRKPNKLKLSYYLVGEYGNKKTDNERPHYHVILFNCELKYLIGWYMARKIKGEETTYLDGKFNFKSYMWTNGYISIGQVEPASIGYCLEYITKPPIVPANNYDKRVPEFSLMSKGLGKKYLSSNMVAWHKADLKNRMYIPYEDHKIPMPRYYKEKIYTKWQRETVARHYADKEKEYILTHSIEEIDIEYQKFIKLAVASSYKMKNYKSKKTIL